MAGWNQIHSRNKWDGVLAQTGTATDPDDLVKKQDVDSLVPAGIISAYGGTAVPTGWFLCDGSEVSRTIYAALFANIGTNFGPGDSFSTFNLPDFRGMFLRGAGIHGSLKDANGDYYTGNSVGNHKNDSFQGHEHTVPGEIRPQGTATNLRELGGSATSNADTIATVTDGSNGTPRTDVETKPVNFSVNFIIKY